MKPKNIDDIRASFTVQAARFESGSMNFSKQEYLDYTVRSMEPRPADSVLDAAAGTCACGRAVAPFVESVVCLDATRAMLAAGRKEAEKSGIANMRFIEGFVEEIPFPDGHFDIVLTRLAFHHFSDMGGSFSEMDRVLKPGGKLVVIDMEAAAEELREIEDAIETMRDPSHVKNRSTQEFLDLYGKYGYSVVKQESTKISVSLRAWLDLTNTPGAAGNKITALLRADIHGGKLTGFSPYFKGNEIYFDQRWLLMMGVKSAF